MPADPILPSVISALSGLAGVALGGGLTFWREWRQERMKTRKNGEFLAILVVAHLDDLARGCLMVSFDDGTVEGRPAASDGCNAVTVAAPTFDPLSLDVEWKALPSDLMYEILNLPNRIEALRQHVAETWEFDDPPEYTEFFWARQYGFAALGLEVSELAVQLRKFANLPLPQEIEGDLSRVQLFHQRRDKVEQERTAYQARLNSPTVSFGL